MSLLSCTFALSSLTSSTKGVVSLIIFVLFFVLVINAFFEAQLIYSFWANPDDFQTVISAYLLALFFTPFSFSKIYADFYFKTIVNEKNFGWKELFEVNENPISLLGDTPPSYIFILLMIGSSVMYFLISWYMDNVFSNHLSFFFFLFPSYWVPSFSSPKTTTEGSKDEVNVPEDKDLLKEFNDARDYSSEKSKNLVLRIINLSKTFSKFFFFKKVKAVDHLNLCVETNSITSLLGKNGAGKTTAINALQGQYANAGINKKNGDVIMDSKFSVQNEVMEIRKRLGVCNQFDNLIPSFTPIEHLYLIGEMKRIPRKRIKKLSTQLLHEVGLFKVRNKRVSKFSGGMKRRVSLILALVSQDKCRLLCADEPSAGLDPVSRMKGVWKLLWKYKKNRGLILTSHSMEEVQFLANKIAVLVKGKLAAVGNSVHLKKKYKTGYNIKLIFKDNALLNEYKEYERRIFAEILPKESKLVEKHDRIYQFLIPHEQVHCLATSLQRIEAIVKSEDQWITKYSVSSTTLEDVFMKVNEEAEIGRKKEEIGKVDQEKDTIVIELEEKENSPIVQKIEEDIKEENEKEEEKNKVAVAEEPIAKEEEVIAKNEERNDVDQEQEEKEEEEEKEEGKEETEGEVIGEIEGTEVEEIEEKKTEERNDSSEENKEKMKELQEPTPEDDSSLVENENEQEISVEKKEI